MPKHSAPNSVYSSSRCASWRRPSWCTASAVNDVDVEACSRAWVMGETCGRWQIPARSSPAAMGTISSSSIVRSRLSADGRAVDGGEHVIPPGRRLAFGRLDRWRLGRHRITVERELQPPVDAVDRSCDAAARRVAPDRRAVPQPVDPAVDELRHRPQLAHVAAAVFGGRQSVRRGEHAHHVIAPIGPATSAESLVYGSDAAIEVALNSTAAIKVRSPATRNGTARRPAWQIRRASRSVPACRRR